MRTLVIDTETTGLSSNDRIVELAAVELIDNKRTGVVYHAWFNPECDSHPKALEVHGLTTSWLADKPLFKDMAANIADFLIADLWVIHNAPFDMRFLKREFARITFLLPQVKTFCTLAHGRKQYNLGENTLNKLCEIHEIDTSGRVMHGALTDAELLTQLYLKMGCPHE